MRNKDKAQTDKRVVEVGIRLQEIRKVLGIKQKDFARQMNISNANLSEIEQGNAKPRFELLYNIIRLHNVNISYLFYGEGEMFQPDNAGNIDFKRFPGLEEWLEDFLWYMENSVLVRAHIMLAFRQYLLENRQLVDNDIADSRPGRKKPETISNAPGKTGEPE